jgi:hypothetical protein
VKRKNLIELPEQDDNVPAGFFSIEVGDSRLLLDAEGKEKPPAEVRTMKRRKKGPRLVNKTVPRSPDRG